jgi:hypothetical protein
MSDKMLIYISKVFKEKCEISIYFSQKYLENSKMDKKNVQK